MTSPREQAGTDFSAHAETGRERRILLRLEGFFEDRSPAFATVVGVVLVLVILAVDVLTGPRLSPSLFYLAPVAIVTWRLGRAMGTAVAAAGAGAWLVADLIGGLYSNDSLMPYWNTCVRFAVLFVVVALLATVRESLQRQRDLAAHETAAAEQLRAINDAKDTLLHALSHDLKGPIAAVLGSAQSLQRKEQLQITHEEEDALLNGIMLSGKKLDRLVNDLLDLERLDRGLVAPECEPTDLGTLARRLVDEADFLAGHPVRVAADPVEIAVDAAKVERIVENLLVNAAKHTPAGTPVLVRVQEKSDGVVVSVEDEGPGIPDEMKRTIFQPFRQGADAKAAGSGAGIGLSLVAKFAELHGGDAWVEDRPGGGTIFRVSLPGPVRRLPVPGSAEVQAEASVTG